MDAPRCNAHPLRSSESRKQHVYNNTMQTSTWMLAAAKTCARPHDNKMDSGVYMLHQPVAVKEKPPPVNRCCCCCCCCGNGCCPTAAPTAAAAPAALGPLPVPAAAARAAAANAAAVAVGKSPCWCLCCWAASFSSCSRFLLSKYFCLRPNSSLVSRSISYLYSATCRRQHISCLAQHNWPLRVTY